MPVFTTRFGRDARGSVALQFSIAALPLIVGVGAALDYSLATSRKAELQNIADAVALAIAPLPAAQRPAAADTALAARASASDFTIAAKTWSTASDGTFTARLQARAPAAFMRVVGVSDFTLNVTASARQAQSTPLATTFTPTLARGWFWKNVSVWLHMPGAPVDTMIANYVYQPQYFDQGIGGIGSLTSNPTGTVIFSAYDKLYLRMSVRRNGCPPDQAPVAGTGRSGVMLQCVASPGATDPGDLELRTDDPNTSHHLYVAGVALPRGVVAALTDILKCGQTVSHAWEDGGNFADQDYFFDVTTQCGVASWSPPRLVN